MKIIYFCTALVCNVYIEMEGREEVEKRNGFEDIDWYMPFGCFNDHVFIQNILKEIEI